LGWPTFCNYYKNREPLKGEYKVKVWNYYKLLLGGLAALGILVACSDHSLLKDNKSNKTTSTIVDAQKVLDDPELTNSQKAVQLVNAGEQLFTPQAFFLSDPIFKAALEKDPSNKKAQLYNNMLKPMMNLKGILGRVEPLMKKDDREYAKYKKQLDERSFAISRRGDNNKVWWGSYLPSEFLSDATNLPKISTEKELQDFFKSQIAVYNDLRMFLNRNINLEADLSLSDQWLKERADNRSVICRYTRISDFSVQVDCEENNNFMNVKIDRGEMEAFKAGAAGMQIYQIINSAYDITNTQSLAMQLRSRDHLTQQHKIETISSDNDKIGTLQDDNQLAEILNLGKDGMIGARWVRQNHIKLCPGINEGTAYGQRTGGTKKDILRREGFLFDEGICWDQMEPRHDYQKLGQIFDTIDMALKGQVVEIRAHEKVGTMHHNDLGIPTGVTYHTPGNKISADVKPSIALSNPVKDLREIKPKSYNDCGNVLSFEDNTLGGVFINGDADDYLRKTGQINQQAGSCEGPM